MKYVDYKEKKQAEFNALPIFFAFGHEQFRQQLEKRGVDYMEAKEHVVAFGYGGYYLKKDASVIDEYLAKDHGAELRELMENDLHFAREAFEYEMANHEYPINWEGDFDVCDCFGRIKFDEEKDGIDYLQELGFSEAVQKVYIAAREHILRTMEY